MVQQARTALDLQERDVVQGQHKVTRILVNELFPI